MPLKKRSGFALVEVLVALFLLAIGLLGVLTMQSQSTRYNNDAYLASQAVIFAYDIADRMRLNPNVLNLYTAATFGTPAADVDDCLNDSCEPDAMAGWDLEVWKDDMAAALPEGDGSISAVAGADRTYNIAVRFYSTQAEGYVQRSVTVRF